MLHFLAQKGPLRERRQELKACNVQTHTKGVSLGSLWCHLGVTLGSLWDRFGPAFGHFSQNPGSNFQYSPIETTPFWPTPGPKCRKT